MPHKNTQFIPKVPMLLIFLILIYLTAFAKAQSNLIVNLGNSIIDSDIDGVIGDEWDDVTSYSNIEVNPTGNAQMWLKHDQTYLYIALRFEVDSNNPWVSLQLGNPNCMTSNTDGAIFGHDDLSANGYNDIYFGGFGVINSDNSQDGIGAIDISMNTLTIELKKPLNTQDSDGRDIQWLEDNSYDIIIMWDSNGGGSSGGSTSHTTNSPKPKTIYIEPQTTSSPTPTTTPTPTPDSNFSDLIPIIGVVVVIIIVAVILIYFKMR